MSLYWFNFQPKNTESLNKDEKDLFRIRDYDDPNINKAKLVNKNFLYPHRDSNGTHDKFRVSNITPKDPIYDTLTENERVENGLPTKFQYRINSIYNSLITGFALGKDFFVMLNNFFFNIYLYLYRLWII
jgi:hypothetical protein